MPDNFIFIAFYMVLPKRTLFLSHSLARHLPYCSPPAFFLPLVFLNSLLATLNARRPLRETNSGVMSIPLSTTSAGGAHMAFSSRSTGPHGVHSHGIRATRDDTVRAVLGISRASWRPRGS